MLYLDGKFVLPRLIIEPTSLAIRANIINFYSSGIIHSNARYHVVTCVRFPLEAKTIFLNIRIPVLIHGNIM